MPGFTTAFVPKAIARKLGSLGFATELVLILLSIGATTSLARAKFDLFLPDSVLAPAAVLCSVQN